MASQDITSDALEDLSWSGADASGSLDVVFQYAQQFATNAVGWYIVGKNDKKKAARRLRRWSIYSVGIAGIIPVLAKIIEEWTGSSKFDAAWASVLFGVAGILVGLDRFFGYSSAWTRYTDAELRIQSLLHTFQIDWQMSKAKWREEQPSAANIQEMLKKARQFVASVDGVIKRETDEWANEFQNVVRRLDESGRASD